MCSLLPSESNIDEITKTRQRRRGRGEREREKRREGEGTGEVAGGREGEMAEGVAKPAAVVKYLRVSMKSNFEKYLPQF